MPTTTLGELASNMSAYLADDIAHIAKVESDALNRSGDRCWVTVSRHGDEIEWSGPVGDIKTALAEIVVSPWHLEVVAIDGGFRVTAVPNHSGVFIYGGQQEVGVSDSLPILPHNPATMTTLEELALDIELGVSGGCRVNVWGGGDAMMAWIAGLDNSSGRIRHELEWIRGSVSNADVFFYPDSETMRYVVVPLSHIAGRIIWVVNPDDSVTKLGWVSHEVHIEKTVAHVASVVGVDPGVVEITQMESDPDGPGVYVTTVPAGTRFGQREIADVIIFSSQIKSTPEIRCIGIEARKL